MSKAKESVPDVIEKLVESVTLHGKNILDDVSSWGFDDVAEDVKGFVKKNPLKSLGIAVGVGFVLSSLLRSSRGDK